MLSRYQEFLAVCPDYPVTMDVFRQADFTQLDQWSCVYLDQTGACPIPRSLKHEHSAWLDSAIWGNPHSDYNGPSQHSTEQVELARTAVLTYFHADTSEYDCIFTSGATASLRMLRTFDFSPSRNLVLTADQHNSANGLRECAASKGARVRYVGLTSDLRINERDLGAALNELDPGLFVFPAQSNFSGVIHPLEYSALAQQRGWQICLDAAAYVPTNMLDLRYCKPDFVAISFYKIFGYPSGVGCLLARHEALRKLDNPGFAGGSVHAASVNGMWHVLLDGHAAFEEGTPNFQFIPAVSAGLRYMQSVNIPVLHRRLECLTSWLLQELRALRHENGSPVVKFYGPQDCVSRGATIALNFLTPDGEPVDERLVGIRARQNGIALRTGCFCNPGAAEAAFGLSPDIMESVDWEHLSRESLDPWLKAMHLKTAGAVRISLGLPTIFNDVEYFIDFAKQFVDPGPAAELLAPRSHC